MSLENPVQTNEIKKKPEKLEAGAANPTHFNHYMQPGHEPHVNVGTLEDRASRISDQEKAKEISDNLKKRSRVSNLTDYTPVVGSAKMLFEGLRGSQYGTGTEIKGWKRAVHGLTGAGFLVSDLTGVGAIGSLGGKILTKFGIRAAEKGVEKAIEKSLEKRLFAEASKLDARGNARVEKSEKI